MKPCEILQTNKQLARCESEERSKHTNTITPSHLIQTNTNTQSTEVHKRCDSLRSGIFKGESNRKSGLRVCVWVCGRVLNEQEEEGFVNFISFVYFSFNKHTHTHKLARTLPSVFSSCGGNIPHFLCVFMFKQYTQSTFIAALRGRHAGGCSPSP